MKTLACGVGQIMKGFHCEKGTLRDEPEVRFFVLLNDRKDFDVTSSDNQYWSKEIFQSFTVVLSKLNDESISSETILGYYDEFSRRVMKDLVERHHGRLELKKETFDEFETVIHKSYRLKTEEKVRTVKEIKISFDFNWKNDLDNDMDMELLMIYTFDKEE